MKTLLEETVKTEEYEEYLENGKDFINDQEIWNTINNNQNPTEEEIQSIIEKSLEIQTLTPSETAKLINIKDPKLWEKIFKTAAEIKRKVYDNRIVVFAPLYCSNHCVNNCLYCGFRKGNRDAKRRKLSLEEVKKEVEVLAGEIGHKRLIVVYGEHPQSNARYIADTIQTIYSVKVKTRNGFGQIRRVNVNAAPMSISDLKLLNEVGIGTFQVFQETYNHEAYGRVHPKGTVKSDYQWRLYCMHRAFKAGIDDVGIGALFGLYDWRFEVMGLLYHAIELEEKFGIGPHTVSFPRLNPAKNAEFVQETRYKVSDEDFKKIIAIIRLSIPYTGMIITARESGRLRREVMSLGCTQTDASTRIGVGSYRRYDDEQELEKQQFLIGDSRDLDDVIREFAEMGYITSFCTAGYRCGRTGKRIMDLLRSGQEGRFCKLNAILTFREWLDDFASEETREVGEKLIKREIDEVKRGVPEVYSKRVLRNLLDYYGRIRNGQRDLYF